mgnify:FL=1
MKTKIAFVGTDSYAVLNPAYSKEYFGGEAVQQVLLARAFRDAGFDVSMICLDYGQPDGETLEDITVYKTHGVDSGLPVIRFLHPRMTLFNSALKRADADIYFQSCAGANTGFVARFCKKYKRKFVFRLASDTDCIPGAQLIQYYRDRKIYEYGLRNADVVSAQSAQQQLLLENNYSLTSAVINMTCDIPTDDHAVEKTADFLWVSNIRQCKRPDLLLDLANATPELSFKAIGGPMNGEEALYDTVVRKAATIPNLEFLGPVPYHQMSEHFASARAFLNTSDIEGFPNTFLQAWAQKAPILSFFDPDGLVQSLSAGIIATDIEDMITQSSSMLSDSNKIAMMGSNGYKYVQENYSGDQIVLEYENALA